MSDAQVYQSFGPRQILRITQVKGIYSVLGQPTDDPAWLEGWTTGFVVTKAGKLVTEQRLHPVPVDANGYIADIDPDQITVRVAAVGGIAQSALRPYAGRMLYIVADVPPSAWRVQNIPAKTSPMTVILKMATLATEEPNTNYFPPRGGVDWTLAHELHSQYGPPWGNQGYLANDLDLQFYNGHMYFASYDRVGLHPDPQMKEEKVPDGAGGWTWDGAASAYRGGLWFDGQGGDANEPWGPATPTTKIAYGEYPQGSSIRLTDGRNRKIYANTLGVYRDILFAGAAAVPGHQLVRWATPGEAHLSGIGWVANNFLQVAKWEGWGIAKLIGTSDALYICTDTAGIWGLYGKDPSEWQLYKIADIDVLGQRSANVISESGELCLLDRQNRLFRGRMGRLQRIDETFQAERDVADLAGGVTPPINQLEQFIYIGGMASTTLRAWQREATMGQQPLYEKESPRPRIFNKYSNAGTLSRYFGFSTQPGYPAKGGIDAAFDPANARLYLCGNMYRGRERREPNSQLLPASHSIWYVDYGLYPRNYVKGSDDFRYFLPQDSENVKYTDFGAFVPWFFGTRHDLKRIHSVFVTLRPTGHAGLFGYQPPTPVVRFWCRYLTTQGWTAPAPDTTQSYAELGWIPMALIDWVQDPRGWTPNYNVPADSRPHRIAIQADEGYGDIGKGMYAFQLGWEFFGTNPPTGVVLDEVAVEYEVVRSWP